MVFPAVISAQCVIQLTDNEYNDVYPQIDNGQVAWIGSDGHDTEIFFWDGTEIIQVTDNEYLDIDLQLHDGKIAWRGRVGRYEIFFWDGESIIQLTDNGLWNDCVRMHNGQVIWVTSEASNYPYIEDPYQTLYYWDGITTQVVSEKLPFRLGTDVGDCPANIHNGQITWKEIVGDYSGSRVMLKDGDTIIQLADDHTGVPLINNGQVVWEYGHHIYIWKDGNLDSILQYGYHIRYLQIDNGLLAYQYWSGDDYFIKLWDGVNEYPEFSGYYPDLHDGELVFLKEGDDEVSVDWDIVWWDGANLHTILEGSGIVSSAKIHNSQIVWSKYLHYGSSNDNSEIFITCPSRSHDRPVERPRTDTSGEVLEELRPTTPWAESLPRE